MFLFDLPFSFFFFSTQSSPEYDSRKSKKSTKRTTSRGLLEVSSSDQQTRQALSRVMSSDSIQENPDIRTTTPYSNNPHHDTGAQILYAGPPTVVSESDPSRARPHSTSPGAGLPNNTYNVKDNAANTSRTLVHVVSLAEGLPNLHQTPGNGQYASYAELAQLGEVESPTALLKSQSLQQPTQNKRNSMTIEPSPVDNRRASLPSLPPPPEVDLSRRTSLPDVNAHQAPRTIQEMIQQSRSMPTAPPFDENQEDDDDDYIDSDEQDEIDEDELENEYFHNNNDRINNSDESLNNSSDSPNSPTLSEGIYGKQNVDYANHKAVALSDSFSSVPNQNNNNNRQQQPLLHSPSQTSVNGIYASLPASEGIYGPQTVPYANHILLDSTGSSQSQPKQKQHKQKQITHSPSQNSVARSENGIYGAQNVPYANHQSMESVHQPKQSLMHSSSQSSVAVSDGGVYGKQTTPYANHKPLNEDQDLQDSDIPSFVPISHPPANPALTTSQQSYISQTQQQQRPDLTESSKSKKKESRSRAATKKQQEEAALALTMTSNSNVSNNNNNAPRSRASTKKNQPQEISTLAQLTQIPGQPPRLELVSEDGIYGKQVTPYANHIPVSENAAVIQDPQVLQQLQNEMAQQGQPISRQPSSNFTASQVSFD